MKYVLDTNILIYLLQGRLASGLPCEGAYYVSVISEIEILAYPDITPDEELNAKRLLQHLTSLEISPEIKEETIRLRKQYRVKLPDALIAATVLDIEGILLTNDLRLANISEIVCQTLPLCNANNQPGPK